MPESLKHPDWLAVGRKAIMQRRAGRSIAWSREVEVVRHTATSVVVKDSQHGNETRFRNSHGVYVMTPAYLDYRTVLLPAQETGGDR